MGLYLARTLQVVGLAWLPVGLYRGWSANDVGAEMTFLAAGAGLFVLGRLLEARTKR